MKNLVETLRSKKTGYGHFDISIEIDGEIINTITTNTLAIDAAFDEDYDLKIIGEDRYYESRLEAQESLVNEILRKNGFDTL